MPDQVNEPPASAAVPRWRIGVMAQQAALQARLREIIGADQDGGEHL